VHAPSKEQATAVALCDVVDLSGFLKRLAAHETRAQTTAQTPTN
jgi:hypothetical protein